MFVFLVGLLVTSVALYLYLSWDFDFWRRRRVAGPVPRAYLGTFPKTALFDKNSNYIQETTEIYRKYFRKHRFIGVFEYRTPKLLFLDPALVSNIYTKYFKHFGDNSLSDVITWRADPLFKPNPFIEKLAQWKERRMELAPAYSMLKVKAMYSATENSCRQLEQYIGSKIESKQAIVASKDICSRFIADALCNVIFGLDAKAFDEKSDFVEQSLGMFHSTPYDHIRFAVYTIFPWLGKIYPNQLTSTEFTKWFKNMFDQAVKLRKQNNISRDDYLNYLIEMRNKKNTPMDLIYAHAFTFFLNGFETTSYILGNAVNNIAQHKECQEKLRAEIKSYDHITFEELHQMPYMDAVVNETTRISPFPFPIWKNCTESIDLEDFDGKIVHIEKGVKIILPINALHSHPDYYENPEKFVPERFDESTGGVKRLKDAGVFMPFGNGPRICLGLCISRSD
ncbi:probable cytochrome P450 28a5 [Sitodiplosis mosellana]|uniref:probable cytochrome P450 28a5 n=1 Tax=Sitodiplosis mosellana TaxID=263140 RepID=UPI0024453379|nr:probable cytochrome P450 28a5 [Sitodiplosis mosellana]